MSLNHIKGVSIVVECAPLIFWFYTWKVTKIMFYLKIKTLNVFKCTRNDEVREMTKRVRISDK